MRPLLLVAALLVGLCATAAPALARGPHGGYGYGRIYARGPQVPPPVVAVPRYHGYWYDRGYGFNHCYPSYYGSGFGFYGGGVSFYFGR